MQFLHPTEPTRVSVIKATPRIDKNQVRWLRLCFSMPVHAKTPWLPHFLRKEILGAVAAGGDADQIRFDAEIGPAKLLFSPAPDMEPNQTMPGCAVTGFELRRVEEGVTFRFTVETRLGDDVGRWLAANYGTDVFLRCEDAQPELPGVDHGGRASGPKVRRRTAAMAPPAPALDRGKAYLTAPPRGGGMLATDYPCPVCRSPVNLPCRDMQTGAVARTHARRKALPRAEGGAVPAAAAETQGCTDAR